MAIEGLATPQSDFLLDAIKKHSGKLQESIKANRAAQTVPLENDDEVVKVDAEHIDIQPPPDGKGQVLDVVA